MDPPDTITQKCKYALRAIFELAWRDTTVPVKIQDIATAQAIPPRFLEVILAELKRGGFVESRRGNEGGYLLALPAHKLTIGQVIAFLQTSGRTRRPARKKRDVLGDYAFAQLWKKASTAVSDVYGNTSFATLVQQELARRKAYVPEYAI